jgi:uncharacterized protein (TIGR03067 family)
MFKRAALLGAAGLALAFAPAPFPKPDPSKAELKRLQGTWVQTLCTRGGTPVAVASQGELTVVIAGDRMTYNAAGGGGSEWVITLDARTKHRIMDLTGVGRSAGNNFLGVYRLQGDTLTLCSRLATPPTTRPANLTDRQPGDWLEVFQRRRR